MPGEVQIKLLPLNSSTWPLAGAPGVFNELAETLLAATLTAAPEFAEKMA